MGELVTIIGGAGAVGELYLDFFSRHGYDVAILDNNQAAAQILAKKNNYMIADKETIEASDIVIFSVPIDKTKQAIEEYGPLIKEYAWAMDTTSVKIEPMQALLDNTGEYVNILGTHPMFRPTIGFNKQNVAFIEERIIDEQNRTELQEIYNMFANEGAHLMEITADKHDRAMALVQGLSHVQNLLFTNRIEESEFSIEELGTLSTPVYNMKLDSALRMLAGDPRLPALIQVHNPYCKHLISDIIEIYHMIEKYIENKDVDGLTEFVSDLKEYVGKYAEDASQRTDKLIGEPRFVTEIYFERHDTDIMSKIYKGTRNQKELDATLYQSSFERNGKEAIPIEEKDIMKATIFTGDAGKFTRSDKITAAREKYWTNYPYSKNGASVFYINNIENPGKYNNIVMTPINPKNPEATEKRHKRTRVKMNNNFTDPILNFFDTIRKNHIFEKTELPFVAIRSPHKIKRNND